MPVEKRVFGISRNVFAMGLVSLFNDIASEMIYPVLPIFLATTLGAPIVAIGLIEGVAESVSSVFRVAFGWLSDRLAARKPFIVVGYSVSTVAKMMFGLATSWHFVFSARTVDRFGKGVRTAARDALLSASTSADTRGRSFGFHRAMDSLGAVVGPLIALLLLPWFLNDLKMLFFIAFVPSLIGVFLLIFLVREIAPARPIEREGVNWRMLGVPYFVFLSISAVFAFGNSSEAFMVLRAKELGLSLSQIILVYIFFNMSYSICATPAGIVSDKIGPKKVMIIGFLLFAGVYISLGFIANSTMLWILFPLYGFYMALTDGIGKAYIANLVAQERLGTAYGIYQVVVGLCLLGASLFAGILWTYLHSSAPFIFGSIMALLAAVLLMIF